MTNQREPDCQSRIELVVRFDNRSRATIVGRVLIGFLCLDLCMVFSPCYGFINSLAYCWTPANQILNQLQNGQNKVTFPYFHLNLHRYTSTQRGRLTRF